MASANGGAMGGHRWQINSQPGPGAAVNYLRAAASSVPSWRRPPKFSAAFVRRRGRLKTNFCNVSTLGERRRSRRRAEKWSAAGSRGGGNLLAGRGHLLSGLAAAPERFSGLFSRGEGPFWNAPGLPAAEPEACEPIRREVGGGRVAARGQAPKSIRRRPPRDLDGRYRR